MYVLSYGKSEASPSFHTPEDAAAYDADKGVFVVADGVTRLRSDSGEYPDPSPARLAADAFCGEVLKSLREEPAAAEDGIRKAFGEANAAIARLNQRLGLAEAYDYLYHDLAGTVGVAAVVSSDKVRWGNIGDCGVAVVGGDLVLKNVTIDDVAIASEHFPDVHLPRTQRLLQIRRDYRNQPHAKHPTFGVMTGESAALNYIRVGTWDLADDDLVLVFSDGAKPLLTDAKALALIRDQHTLQQYIETARASGQLEDELTLMVMSAPIRSSRQG